MTLQLNVIAELWVTFLPAYGKKKGANFQDINCGPQQRHRYSR
jgi:hypothetical protein